MQLLYTTTLRMDECALVICALIMIIQNLTVVFSLENVYIPYQRTNKFISWTWPSSSLCPQKKDAEMKHKVIAFILRIYVHTGVCSLIDSKVRFFNFSTYGVVSMVLKSSWLVYVTNGSSTNLLNIFYPSLKNHHSVTLQWG